VTRKAAEEIRRFGIAPKVALLSHSSFGSSEHPQAKKMQAALALVNAMAPDLEIEGEMHGDAALDEAVRVAAFPNSRLKGAATYIPYFGQPGLPAFGRGQHGLDGVTLPLQRLASQTIDVAAVLHNLVAPGAASGHIAAAYRKYLFGNRTLQDLPPDDGPGAGPRFIFNGANLQTGVLWRFSRPYMADYRVGTIPAPTLELAVAVAVSSAAPPFLSPVYLKLDAAAYTPNSGLDLQQPPYTTRPVLTDGGVYDNLGLETAWKRCKTVLVSDGGGHMGDNPRPHGDWLRQMFRVTGVIDNQVRSLRKRQVIDSYTLPAGDPNHRAGAYWGIRSDIANYGLADALPCPLKQTTTLADVATRLAALPDMLQERLINWGYAVCDAALRRHVDPALPPPQGFPYPAARVGQEEVPHA